MVNEEYDSYISDENPSVDPDTGDEVVDSTDKPVRDDAVVDPDAPILDPYNPVVDPSNPVVDEEDENDPTVDEPGITTRSSNISVSVKEGRDENISIKKTYNTVSCPCSSYAVLDSNGAITCEKLDFGVKRTIRTMALKNHYINGKMPRVGDKWKCLKDCKQDNFRWNTYHVVKVEENRSEISSSLVNSILSTSNCYIPPTTLKDYKGDDVDVYLNKFKELASVFPEMPSDIHEPITYIDGKPLYETTKHVMYHEILLGRHNVESDGVYNNYTYFENKDIKGYLPGITLEDKNYISSIVVNTKDVLGLYLSLIKSEEYENKTLFNSSNDWGKILLNSAESVIKINIKGVRTSFDLNIEDSSNCTILNKRLKNINLDSDFELNQKIPALPKGLSSETYTLTITPAIGCEYYTNGGFQPALGPIKTKIYQFASNTITLSATDSTISNTTHTGSSYVRSTETTSASTSVTFSGETNQKTSVDQTHIINVKRSSGTDNYYIKDKIPNIKDVISLDSTIKKKIIKEEADGKVLDYLSEITVVNDFTSDGTTVSNKGDIERGMTFDFSVEKTKTVRKSIDLEEHLKEPCDDCDDELNILTNKFELDNTSDLFKEMYVEGVDYKGIPFTNNIISIDCSKSITLQDEYILNKNTELTFKYFKKGVVTKVTPSSKGDRIKLSKSIVIPDKTSINFNNVDSAMVDGYIKYDKSGGDGTVGITVSTVVTDVKFGKENTTITIDTDSLITNKPNACDQYLTVAKGQETYIDFSKCDIDYNKYSKTVTITKQPRGGVVENATYQKFVGDGYVATNLTYMKKFTPNSNFKGKDTIKYTTSDGVNSSDEKIIYLTVK